MKDLKKTLAETTTKILEVQADLSSASDQYVEAMLAYDIRKAQLYLHQDTSGYKRAEERDAHVTLVLETEGLTEPMQRSRFQIKKLQGELDSYRQVSQNLRTLMNGGGK